MATFKVKHGKGKYHDNAAYGALIAYITNPKKVRDEGVIGAAVIPEIAAQAMETVARAYHKEDGLKLRHSILSFDSKENVSFETAKEIAQQTMDFYANQYQMVAAIHENTEQPHIHFLMNTINYHNGSKYRGTKKDYYDSIKHIQKLTERHGIHTIPVKDSPSEV